MRVSRSDMGKSSVMLAGSTPRGTQTRMSTGARRQPTASALSYPHPRPISLSVACNSPIRPIALSSPCSLRAPQLGYLSRPPPSPLAAPFRPPRRPLHHVQAASTDTTERDRAALEKMLAEPLQANANLKVGYLPNGFRYVILRNPTPPQRFEAHLEMHAGSVDETEEQQGIAHLVEHVTFLGSRKRENLLGTGVRSNAYTDFHHTVFHFHAPSQSAYTGGSMLPAVLDSLAEIAFEPEFSVERIEKERKAVLAEAQMMNTIEYRIDCQLLKYLHAENNLGCRFPIGKVEQVKEWPKDKVKAFWERWYFPANATLYVVGDVPETDDDIEKLVATHFGHLPAAYLDQDGAPIPQGQLPPALAEKVTQAQAQAQPQTSPGASATAPPAAPLPTFTVAETDEAAQAAGWVRRERDFVRPPVKHVYGADPQASLALQRTTPAAIHQKEEGRPMEGTAPVNVFRHPLLQQFMLSVFCKLPILEIHTGADMKRAFLVRLVLSVFQFRLNGRYNEGAPFLSVELDSSDAGREGCCVSTLTITSEPADWADAIKVALEESCRLQRHGVTEGELERYLDALLRDSEQLANQAEKTPSIDNLDYVMESMALGHTVMNHTQSHQALVDIAATIELSDVNAMCKSLLSFAAYYGKEDALERDYAATKDTDAWFDGPTRTTSIIACVPAYMDTSGGSVGGGGPMQRGPVTTGQHIDAEALASLDVDAVVDPLAEDDDEWGPPPEGAVKFDVSAAEIEAVLSQDLGDIAPKEDIQVPDALVDDAHMEKLVTERLPTYVPLADDQTDAFPPPMEGEIVQRRLSNGVRMNYKHSENEPSGGVLRLVSGGGRSIEDPTEPGAGFGSVSVGVRTVSEAGTVGEWEREQMELFCISKLINCMIDSDEEFVIMDFHFTVKDGGLQGCFQLLHQFLVAPKWDPVAFERAKSMYINHYRSTEKSLERATASRIMGAMIQDDRRFRDPTPEDIEALDLEALKKVVSRILTSNNMEVSVVGDVDPQELEACALKYLGTLPPVTETPAWVQTPPLVLHQPASGEAAHQRWHQLDSDERACALIAGPAPPRWQLPEELLANPASALGYRGPAFRTPLVGDAYEALALEDRPAEDEARRSHPLFRSTSLQLLSEIMNARLFTTVRDSLGLTYDVSFDLTVFDRVQSGWYAVTVTSEPSKIDAALNASLRVLRGLRLSTITPRELARAKRTLISRHETDLKDNGYWLALMTHLQSDTVPLKTVECLRDLVAMYEACTIADIQGAYDLFDFQEGSVFTCIGTSGKTAPGAAAEGGDSMEDKKTQLLTAFQNFLQSNDAQDMLNKIQNRQ